MDFNPVSREEEAHAFVSRTLTRFDYGGSRQADRGMVKGLLSKAAGLSRTQVTRLVGQFVKTGQVVDGRGPARRRPAAAVRAPPHGGRRPPARGGGRDARADGRAGHARRHAAPTRGVRRRRLVRLAHISNGHLYNLRRSTTYRRRRTVLEKTPPSTAIGERRPPRAEGRPGFVRVDTVHQGDLDGDKGIYLINVVETDRSRSAVTQFEYVGAVLAVSERFLVPVLEGPTRPVPVRHPMNALPSGKELRHERKNYWQQWCSPQPCRPGAGTRWTNAKRRTGNWRRWAQRRHSRERGRLLLRPLARRSWSPATREFWSERACRPRFCWLSDPQSAAINIETRTARGNRT